MGRVFWAAFGFVAAFGSAPLAAQCHAWQPGFAFPGPDNRVNSLAVYDDGTGPALYAYGSFAHVDAAPIVGIARWNGASWSQLGTGLSVTFAGQAGDLEVFDDGTGPALYLAGTVLIAGSVNPTRISRWNGTTWSEVGSGLSGGDVRVEALAVFDDGSGPALYAGGSFTMSGGTPVAHIAKWDGVAWTPVGSGTDGTVTALGVFDEGAGPRLFAGGEFDQPAAGVARWDGATWSTVGGGLNGSFPVLKTFAVHDDGTGPALFAGGYFMWAGGVIVNGIAKWDGTAWSALGSGTNGVVESLETFDDGSGPALWVAGTFLTAGGLPARRIAKWQSSTWINVGDASDHVFDLELFDDGSGTALYLGGEFLSVAGVQAAHICRRSGSTWSALGPSSLGVDATVRAELPFDDGSGPSLFAGGSFTRAGGTLSPGIARWDGTTWASVGGGVVGSVFALAAYDDGSGPALYAGGDFLSAGGVGANRIARWDGSSWSPVGAGMNAPVMALAVHDDGTGPALYAGGTFTLAGGSSAPRVAKWDGVAWTAVGGGIPWGTVQSLASFGQGAARSLYVGGNIAPTHILRWNNGTWSSPGAGVGGPQPRSVDALLVWDDGAGPDLYAAGHFTTPGAGVARWNGTSWSSLANGPGGPVLSLAGVDDGAGRALYADGSRWNGTSWTSLTPPGTFSGSIAAVSGYDSGSGHGEDVCFGGFFSGLGGVPATNFAVLEGCASPGAPFCFGDGSGAACPCANPGSTGRGCQNSAGTGGARFDAFGTSVPDTIAFVAANEMPSALTIFLQGDVSIAPAGFGDGLRCVGGNLKRLYVRSASGGEAAAPGPGDLSVTARSAQLGDAIPSGGVRYYMTYYRDPSPGFCPDPPGSTFNGSNAVAITW